MNAHQFTETDFASVRNELAYYGLNPHDWCVTGHVENTYELIHKDDPEFRLDVKLSSLKAGSLHVDQLSIISI